MSMYQKKIDFVRANKALFLQLNKETTKRPWLYGAGASIVSLVRSQNIYSKSTIDQDILAALNKIFINEVSHD